MPLLVEISVLLVSPSRKISIENGGSLNLVTNKEEASKHEQKEKQVLKEVSDENLAIATNITTNDISEEQIMLDNAVETEIMSQELNEMTNEQ
ncbi:12176_t:CDS:2, partial [Cetraspora pellucida]